MAQRIGAFIAGCEGIELNSSERDFFTKSNPWGLILFKRNVKSTQQLSELAASFRECVKRRDAPVLIDQEGGRVQRLSPASGDWRVYPPARSFSNLYAAEPVAALRAARACGRLMADDLAKAGITVDCIPVLDVPQPGMTEAIGSRTYGLTPEMIIALSAAHVSGLTAGGVLPVMKHMPGHGRATVDSHLELPVTDASREELAESDFVTFAALAHLPMGMTAHVVYTSIDKDNPATQSKRVIAKVIRTQIGFDGLLMTDDLSMQALKGTLKDRAALSIAAGCDIALHCNGVMHEAEQVAEASGYLTGKALRRAKAALKSRQKPQKFNLKSTLADLAAVVAAQA
jgi:beta-N-acetylhexosaminidase